MGVAVGSSTQARAAPVVVGGWLGGRREGGGGREGREEGCLTPRVLLFFFLWGGEQGAQKALRAALFFPVRNSHARRLPTTPGKTTPPSLRNGGQVAVLIIPFCVILGWMMGQPMGACGGGALGECCWGEGT